MSHQDKIYFASRAAEEEERALTASDSQARVAHFLLQRGYTERASVGERVDPQGPKPA